MHKRHPAALIANRFLHLFGAMPGLDSENTEHENLLRRSSEIPEWLICYFQKDTPAHRTGLKTSCQQVLVESGIPIQKFVGANQSSHWRTNRLETTAQDKFFIKYLHRVQLLIQIIDLIVSQNITHRIIDRNTVAFLCFSASAEKAEHRHPAQSST